MIGYITLPRQIIDELVVAEKPTSRGLACIDLISLANFTESCFYLRGNKVVVKRGQIARSQQNLAERWGWSRGKVDRFLNELENEHKIIQQKSRLITLISIVNYDNLCKTIQQTEQQIEQQTVQQIGQQTVQRNNKDNKNNKEKNNNINSSNEECDVVEKSKTATRFSPPTKEEVEKFIEENGYNVDATRFVDFYESKGWFVGKNKMKDWKAAVRGWNARDKGESPRRQSKSNMPIKNVNDEWQ
jgi:hypothetical protein